MNPRTQVTVDLIAGERQRFEQFCRSLSTEELDRPVPGSTWVVKDFISHLATIDTPIAAWFGSIAAEAPARPGGQEAWNVDQFNDAKVAARWNRSLDEIFAEAERERAALVAVMARLTDAQLDSSIHFGGDSKRPPSDIQLNQYLNGWARHDVIHVADMLKALPERRDDPAIAAWLAEPPVAAVVGFYQKAMA
ncbi:MAG: DinB family protein [Dehalococcoidia bacterium]